ncbi:hypothetical protein CR983_01630 [Candidatus Saccharibacteria bacterium]|nr:MAG: hypothetical protein CR983_01630 [Candidatus Saccharibacteria bacterium]
MLKKLLYIGTSVGLVSSFALATLAQPAYAAVCSGTPQQCARHGSQKTGTTGGTSLNESFRIVTNMLLFLVGAISVIMLVIGAIRYTTSGGDQTRVTSAKNTIMYAIVGLVLAIVAYAIVQFVIDSFV